MSTPDPKKTYALIVGIEKYDKGSSWNLDGPGSDALKFAKWLFSRGVPITNILLYISELSEPNQLKDNESLRPLWQNKQKATRDNIHKAITKILPNNKEKGDLLYIFWGGHGVTIHHKDTIQDKDRRLFYDDGEQNLNLKSLLKSLKSKVFGNFNQQIVIIDACADYYKNSLLNEEYIYEDPNKLCQQVILLATREGYRAKNLDAEKTGLFSKVLLNQLEQEDKLLCPQDINKTIKNVQDFFKKEYYNDPQPIYLCYADADGNECPKSALTQSANNYSILETQWEMLVSILKNISSEALSNYCYQFLSKYSNDSQGNYPNLVQKENFFASLKEILLEIQHHQSNESNLPLIVEFAQFFSQQPELPELLDIQENLNKWIDSTVQKLGIDSNTLNQLSEGKHKRKEPGIYRTGLPYLLLLFEPNISSESNPKFKINLKAELKFQEISASQEIEEEKVDLTISQSIGVNPEDIEDTCLKIYQLIEKSFKNLVFYKNPNKLTIELFLPKQYLVVFAPEVREVPINESNPGWFGSRYKLVLRSYDRFNNYEYYQNLQNKWTELSNLLCPNSLTLENLPNKIVCLKELKPDYNWKKFRQQASQVINVNMDCPLVENIYNCHVQEFLASILRCGIPFSFWLRGKSLEDLKLNEEIETFKFEDVLTVENLQKPEKLFESIRTIRDNAYVIEPKDKQQDYLGYHLGFLFDTPDRLHSKFDLNSGEDILIFNQ
ncbi:caspase family protein [Floridanema evergladense]|uniref:Caspase family protein n=1 Tax=Floridaenema evergladense BLCC-F167 TaxID=3153639 RepID=A0ABV4WKB6_9CYAN